jgi:hypothetical protein
MVTSVDIAYDIGINPSDPFVRAALASINPPPMQTPPELLSFAHFVVFDEPAHLSAEENKLFHCCLD